MQARVSVDSLSRIDTFPELELELEQSQDGLMTARETLTDNLEFGHVSS